MRKEEKRVSTKFQN